MYGNSQAAKEFVTGSRAMLGDLSLAARNWAAMDQRDKNFLLQAAGVNRAFWGCEWDKLSEVERGAIRKAARRAAEWAGSLGVL